MLEDDHYVNMELGTGPRSWQPFGETLLGNPLRAEMVTLLEERPGLNKLRLANMLGTEIKNLEYHLDRLVKGDLVEVRRGRGHETLCFMKADVHLWDSEQSRVFFGRGSSRPVASFLAKQPGASVPEVSSALGISIFSVRRHIRILRECDLVEQSRVEKGTVYHARPVLIDLLERIGDRWAMDEE